ncbi:phosphopantetheine-binding protein [Microbispora sp. ZYX-F-249]|uniref:Phosphopantetheine-binding protein n=1 Tax=Microbispora maris TaxID=3144104 RepID=A0ABV0AXC0_9ACTN
MRLFFRRRSLMCLPSLACASGLDVVPAPPPSPAFADELPLADPFRAAAVFAVESRVAEIWRSVLRVGEGEEDATFADLGGDAMAALRIAGRVRRELGLRVEPGAVAEHQDLRSFVRHVLTGGARAVPAGL